MDGFNQLLSNLKGWKEVRTCFLTTAGGSGGYTYSSPCKKAIFQGLFSGILEKEKDYLNWWK
jgi:hypothetical protein